MIPAPPDAKLTPVRKVLVLLVAEARERYGGEVGRPSLSAAINLVVININISYLKRCIQINFVMAELSKTLLMVALNTIN